MAMTQLPLKYYSQCFSFNSKDNLEERARLDSIQKPLNSFFLYIRAKRDDIAKDYKIHKSHEITKKAAELWSKESKDVKQRFRKMSIDTHTKFKEMLSSRVKSGATKGSIQKKTRILLPATLCKEKSYHRLYYLSRHIGFVSADVYEATRLDSDIQEDECLGSPTPTNISVGC
ncbi:hypothetical protein HK103_002299 [Boothiomyces macroporosus]|uniref:HMG box domain-containing protein n=1 Tax=Boothiomyces macroporosus TaxID=261099 RepID=A0AAD5UMD1_9FUNG|nr:hypothetical protein HK103_002299 [Boothiomyces macroporosus]